jgi:hypothetical protein
LCESDFIKNRKIKPMKNLTSIKKAFKSELVNLDVNELAHELINNHNGETKQMVDLFGKEFLKKAKLRFNEDELNKVQDFIDVFFNTVTK